jgi:hypothetical protein
LSAPRSLADCSTERRSHRAKFAAGIAALVGERIKALAAADFGLGKIDAANQADLGSVVQLLILATSPAPMGSSALGT